MQSSGPPDNPRSLPARLRTSAASPRKRSHVVPSERVRLNGGHARLRTISRSDVPDPSRRTCRTRPPPERRSPEARAPRALTPVWATVASHGMTSEVASACDVLPGPGPHPLAGWRLQRDVGEPQARCRRRRRQDLAGGKVKPSRTQGTRAPGMTGDDSRSSTWLTVVTGTPRFWIRCGRSRRSHSETCLGRVRPLLHARAAGDAGGRRDGRPRCELGADRSRHRCSATTWTTPAAACRAQATSRERTRGWGRCRTTGVRRRPWRCLREARRSTPGEAARRPPSTSRGGGAQARHQRLRGRAAASGRPACGTCAFACGRRPVSVKHPRVSSDRSCGSSERPIPSM